MATEATFAVKLSGYTDVPEGKIATNVTYLEQRARPELRPEPPTDGFALARLRGDEAARYRDLFIAVGEEWLWFSRRYFTDVELAAYMDDPGIEILALTRDGRDIGLVELDWRELETSGDVELALFGLVREAIGGGAGRWLINRAIERAWAREPARFWVHTCSFDHPAALAFYRRSGFVPYKFGLEVADDPRLLGYLPREAGPHIPLIE
ncbi:GNAT family N-acetyltransferase [Methyloraptor flagellatus]|uniref:GNAT family N-acetyltransferase n=1 Tax=Methyloraptor flagellatus TaxID=3162530 RepID=A0AAU7XB69_9HYPH